MAMKKFILETGEQDKRFRNTYRIEADDLHEAINILWDDFGREYGSFQEVVKNTVNA